ncbi:MAG: methylaspartate mutase accessory protein GlmL [Candidatus Saccharicenans sp.]|uniref:methylaspartate mutase accessory protein GlmL n=1 Tax=Candidatus Saccharicenans sp. TaxID=2819258 RepID=UPI00404B2046
MKKIISLDLGSTWTKGGLFVLGEKGLRLEKRIAVPTTQDNLVRGFSQALAGLLQKDKDTPLRALTGQAEIYFSSSAKGGLRIAAIGLVPDLTLQLAKLAAMSAGGKVIASYAFALTRSDISQLEKLQPDILLFSGGTDGGNSQYVLENARKLVASSLSCPVIYAGNRAAAEEVVDLMPAKEVVVTENLMPEVGQVNLEPAREKIREIFLKRIVSGRGLSEIVELFGNLPKPTPLAVFELIEAIPRYQTYWSDLAAIDLGGATTDFYSNTESYLETDTVVLKGIREPKVKRTVEGDLGMRVSAQSLTDSGWPYLEERLLELRLEADRLRKYVDRISRDLDYLPQSEEETQFDSLLAETAVYYAALRHIGGWKETYTPQGKVYVQTGKDLRRVKAIIGSGGFLSAASSAEVMRLPLKKLQTYGQERKLLPEAPIFYADRQYLFSLLGNLVGKYPAEATALAVASVENLNDED